MFKSFSALLFCWLQCYTVALGLDVAMLDKMTSADRAVWVGHFVEKDLHTKDSALAFAETNQLLELSKKWDAPDIAVQAYLGQGNYFLDVLHDPENARKKYAKGADFARLYGLEALHASMLIEIGRSYCQQNQQVLAYAYYLRAHDIFVQIGVANIMHIDQYEYNIGQFFYSLEDYAAAMMHFSIAEKSSSSSPQTRYKVLGAISQCCEQQGLEEDALNFLKKQAQLAQKENNPLWIAESTLTIGEHHLKAGCHSEARIYLTTAHRLSVQNGQTLLAARALISLSQVNLYEGNLHSAAEKLTEAGSYLQQTGATDWYPEFYRGWELIYKQSNDFREAYRFGRLYDHAHDSIQRAKELRTYANIQTRLEGRRHIMQMVQREQADRTDQLLSGLSVCLILLLTVGAYIGWKSQQRRQKNLILARQKAEQAEQALAQFQREQMAVRQQATNEESEFMAMPGPSTSLTDKLPVVSLPPIPDPKAEETAKEALEQILCLTLLTEEDSRHFRLYFEKIHPGFVAQLRKKFPDLTQSETRLLALTKLNLKTREMSEILNVEPNSIRRLRNRIRQKFNLPAGDNFKKLLAND